MSCIHFYFVICLQLKPQKQINSRMRNSSHVIRGLLSNHEGELRTLYLVAHTNNYHSTWETETEGSLTVQGQYGLHRVF